MATTPILLPLTNQESAANDGANWMAIVTADMLTTTATNTAQVLKLMDLKTGDIMMRMWTRVKTQFQNSADAAFNTDTYSVGDTGSATRYIAATEVNANGTVVSEAISSGSTGPYTATDAINVTFNSMTAKKLSDINKGELHIFWKLVRPSLLETASGAQSISTK